MRSTDEPDDFPLAPYDPWLPQLSLDTLGRLPRSVFSCIDDPHDLTFDRDT